MRTKATEELTLADRLSRLSYAQACRILGPHGAALLRAGGALEIQIDEQVRQADDRFVLELPDAHVTITLEGGGRFGLAYSCSACSKPCEHAGAAFSLILEEKLALGLAAPPPERTPVERLSERALAARALEERRERARTERMRVRALAEGGPWGDYLVTSAASGRTYRVALRGLAPGLSFCTCPDFRKNTLGTCKHVLKVQDGVRRRFAAAALRRPHRRRRLLGLRALWREPRATPRPPRAAPRARRRRDRGAAPLPADRGPGRPAAPGPAPRGARPGSHAVPGRRGATCRSSSSARASRDLVAEIRAIPPRTRSARSSSPSSSCPTSSTGSPSPRAPGARSWPTTWASARRSRASASPSCCAREAGIERVLVVCPASPQVAVAERDRALLGRGLPARDGRPRASGPRSTAAAASSPSATTSRCCATSRPSSRRAWDLVILDEGAAHQELGGEDQPRDQGAALALRPRAHRHAAREPPGRALLGGRVRRRASSRPRLPLLPSPPHGRRDGRVLGYKNLAELRDALEPVLLRRTRDSVSQELPPRTDGARAHAADERAVGAARRLHADRRRRSLRKRYITEMDLLRLRKALLDVPHGGRQHLPRRQAAAGLLEQARAPGGALGRSSSREEGRKIVLFSEWTTMLDLDRAALPKRGKRASCGSTARCRRESARRWWTRSRRIATCRLFLTTNAGATGLNLQAANTVINVDLPWNPAVLEQRIARAHRMGQKRPVQVFVLVTEETLEEQLLGDALGQARAGPGRARPGLGGRRASIS